MIRFDSKDLMKTLNNLTNYSSGFLDGAMANRVVFNNQLGELAIKALEEYIDARARANPESLHHVYEWNAVGSPDSRLFEINHVATPQVIKFTGQFLQSSSVSEGSNEPFSDKAYIMENRISIDVEPGESGVLAFENDGEMVFTTKSIFIEHPGGDGVANSFGEAVSDFFEYYFTTTFLRQSGIIENLSYPKEFSQGWTKTANRSTGMTAGKRYLSVKGGVQ